MAIDLYKNRCAVYDGDKPYIFVSYSHKDIEKVVSLIRKLQGLGFRIWYDSGVPAGTEWREEIATKLKNSACVLSLLSENAANSRHFKAEFNYAYYLELPILVAYLDNCVPTPGVEMLVVSQQCIKREHCENDDDLLEEIARAKILLPCLGEKSDAEPEVVLESPLKLQPESNIPKSRIEQLEENAKNGDIEAQIALGDAYYDGIGVEKDYKNAFLWYQKAAAQNHPIGIRRVGYCYENGHGVEKNTIKSFDHYQKAAEMNDPGSIFNLAVCYSDGHGVKQDHSKAMELYQKAADLGNTDALFNLARMYLLGIGTAKDIEKAKNLYQKSAELGDVDSQYFLASRYAIGLHFNQSWDEAVRWYRKAAEQGHASAQKQMAKCYREGLGVPIDEAEAARWQKLYDENPNKK